MRTFWLDAGWCERDRKKKDVVSIKRKKKDVLFVFGGQRNCGAAQGACPKNGLVVDTCMAYAWLAFSRPVGCLGSRSCLKNPFVF
jgi:hypothetical protein